MSSVTAPGARGRVYWTGSRVHEFLQDW